MSGHPIDKMHPPGCAVAFWTGIIVLIAIGAVMCWAVTAYAHDATPTAAQPLGWTYPWSCCSSLDCKRVSGVSVHETPDGYVVDGAKDAAAIGYQDKRIKDSPDGEYHWCAHQAGVDAGKTICLFVPPKGF